MGRATVRREQFIGAMRRVVSSVTVVTTDGSCGRHGATVSAFNSLSADPPSVLICLRAESRIARAVTENGRFCVNVLPEQDAEVAARFAGDRDVGNGSRFDGVALKDRGWACPALAAATAFCCEVINVARHGTHLIFVGHVVEVSQGENPPLIYLDGRYHRVHPN